MYVELLSHLEGIGTYEEGEDSVNQESWRRSKEGVVAT